jgi:molybdenum cofactor biosynthesis protein B
VPIDESLEFRPVRVALLKVAENTSRTDDVAGDVLEQRVLAGGHVLVARGRVDADLDVVVDALRRGVADPSIDCVITFGGTGLSARDVAPEALAQVWEKDIPGFGEMFRSLSRVTIGTSALASRACAGIAAGTCLFALPGSPGGVRDAWDGILATQLDSRHKPCNLVDLMLDRSAGPERNVAEASG